VKSGTVATVTFTASMRMRRSSGTKTGRCVRAALPTGHLHAGRTFTAGTIVTLPTGPKAPGASEGFDVTLPASDAAYCFRVKVSDEAGNASLSNVATVTMPDVTAPRPWLTWRFR